MRKHTVSRPHPPFKVAGGTLTIHQVPVWHDNLVWIVVCNATGLAAAVDGPAAQPVLDYCLKHDIKLTAIFNTHTHGDHIGINRDLAQLGVLTDYRVVGCRTRSQDIPGITEPVDEGDTILLGEVQGTVWRTEGHLDGHISYLFDGVLFCGDTLFGAGCGYLFDGPPAKMQASLARFAELSGETLVCCAHEYTQDNLRFAWSVEADNPHLLTRIQEAWKIRATGASTIPSTIELERETNPFMRWHSPTIQRSVSGSSDRLMDPVDVFAATRKLKDSKVYGALSDADLPLS